MTVKLSLRVPLLLAAALAAGGTAQAQVSRVFVSVNGNDANVCSNIATPCRTLGGGVTQVDASGEVIVIDSGSYAGPTITKAVKINAAPGVVAFSGQPFTVSLPAATDTVVLRGVTVKALTPGTGTGITLTQGNLFLENSVVDGWAVGVSVQAASRVFVKDTTLRNCTTAGLEVSAAAVVSSDNFRLENNASAASLTSGRLTVTRGVISGNTNGIVVSGAGAEVTLHLCQLANNLQKGLSVSSGGLGRVSDSTVTGNATGLENVSATVLTFVNNQIHGNATDMSGTITQVALQ